MKMNRVFFVVLMITLLTALTFPASAAPPDLTGIWQGVLKVGGIELRLVIKVSKTADDQYTATLDSPIRVRRTFPPVSWRLKTAR